MSSVVIKGDTSGQVTLAAPAVAGTVTVTLPSASATMATNVNGDLYPLTSGTVQASTSGTNIDFTSIPSWVKRITVMFNGVSTSGTNNKLIQIGSSSFTTTGYTSTSVNISSTAATTATFTAGFGINSGLAAETLTGNFILTNITSNTWVITGNCSSGTVTWWTSGSLALSGTLDRVRITTAGGTDTFDAGSINILYE